MLVANPHFRGKALHFYDVDDVRPLRCCGNQQSVGFSGAVPDGTIIELATPEMCLSL